MSTSTEATILAIIAFTIGLLATGSPGIGLRAGRIVKLGYRAMADWLDGLCRRTHWLP
ncbi:hypothetical protein RMS29_027820 (plasmid) [Agrobacterium rosae]|uniref:Uncharacterized protein n=1 Tax=Agrobacterium rosae TaxID=1972867 RepID=A0AAW9FLB6_9HYPH|nr:MULTISPECIES: hypothetical protein [Agrobacterium]MDX8321762.1 hypothetical protein [Agrobacterium sp. rho-8.1]MDX8305228.1 hypothetical protein [Agrobacterium rosae]MDX8311509.1 hypothetical protein [Agrobacterium sp. rho-13.3]MDX8316257.1 hypothetical protein [Agrobacterium rosae]MDX8332436.1 hypothetical protein [Agrobacterium rosae]